VQSQIYRNSLESRVFDTFVIVVVTLLALMTLYPLIYVVVTSLNAAYVPNRTFYLWPAQPHLGAYQVVLRNSLFLRAFMNSVFYTTSSALLSVVLTMMTAYPLSIRTFPFRNFFMFMITFTLLFNGGLIPLYLLVKALGMVNTPWAIIVPGALTAFNVILARTYLQENIPHELREAAKVDGAGDWIIFLRIVLPLSAPIIAVIGLFTAVANWNSYFYALLFLNDLKLFPVAMILRDIVVGASQRGMVPVELATSTSGTAVQAATLVVAILPILCVYPFLQRYFVKGIMIGAIKG
jgi:putative aldouronate transport system permease protein